MVGGLEALFQLSAAPMWYTTFTRADSHLPILTKNEQGTIIDFSGKEDERRKGAENSNLERPRLILIINKPGIIPSCIPSQETPCSVVAPIINIRMEQRSSLCQT